MRFAFLFLLLGACSDSAKETNDAASEGSALDVFTPVDAEEDANAPVTPIALADAWVAGWYPSTSLRGTNRYDHTDTNFFTTWVTDPDASTFANVTDCSSFSDVLMNRAYGWNPPTTNVRALAEDYYWAVRGAVRFTEIAQIGDVQIGDAITLLYGTIDTTTNDTGHVAWIDALPVQSAGGPSENGLTQWVVTVIDSADGFHYAPGASQDDRYLGMIDGGQCDADTQCEGAFGNDAVCDGWQLNGGIAVCTYTGVGRGQIRLYVDTSGNIAGYAWGPSAGSTFYARPNPLPTKGNAFSGRDIALGRYTPT